MELKKLTLCNLFNRHDYEYPLNENGVPNRFEKVCKRCGKEQMLVYYKYGNIRYKWVDRYANSIK